MTIRIDVFEGMSGHAGMSKFLVHGGGVPTVAVDADIFVGMDNVPFSLVCHWVRLRVAGGT